VFTPSAGNHALVVISPGFQMARTQYTSYAKHLASWGFAVVLTDYADKSFSPDHPKMAADLKAVIDWSLAQTSLGVETDRVAVAGHSLGGKLSTFAASLDARIKVVLGWDPVDSNNPSVVPEKMSSIQAAIAVVGETTDGGGGGMPCAPTVDNFAAFYAAAGTPAYALTVDGADHMDWVDDGSCTFCGFCSPGTASPELSRTVTRRVNVAWLRRVLFADLSMDVWLDAPPETAVTVERR
jgi:acetyl esterase/lipase